MTITVSGTNGVTFSDSTNQIKGLSVVNFTRKIWSLRAVPGDFSSKQYPEGWLNIPNNSINIPRIHPKSIFLVKWTMAMRTNYSDCLHWRASWGGSGWYQGTMPYDAGFSANSRPFHSTFLVTSTATGANTMRLRWRTANNQSGNMPATIWNPNSSDDGRYTQEYSAATIWEIR